MPTPLDLSSDFSPQPTPATRQRATVLSDLAVSLESALEEPAGHPRRATLDLGAQARGQQGSVALMPWVRVYSPRYAPTAQEGVYLTYLSAADGSRAYRGRLTDAVRERPGGPRRSIGLVM